MQENLRISNMFANQMVQLRALRKFVMSPVAVGLALKIDKQSYFTWVCNNKTKDLARCSPDLNIVCLRVGDTCIVIAEGHPSTLCMGV